MSRAWFITRIMDKLIVHLSAFSEKTIQYQCLVTSISVLDPGDLKWVAQQIARPPDRLSDQSRLMQPSLTIRSEKFGK